jgi:hypothetical protein
LTATPIAPAPAVGLWRRLRAFLEAAEMSSGEHQFDRIDALEYRVNELQRDLRALAAARSKASRS